MEQTTDWAAVVVGTDGTPGSRATLVYGLVAAARRGADLRVVAGHAIPMYHLGEALLDTPHVEPIRDGTHDRVAAMVRNVVDEVRLGATACLDAVPVRLTVEGGPVADVLVEESQTADLLVIGGRGAWRGLVLGSVSLHCALYAACPVMVVHPPRGRPPGSADRREQVPADV